MSFIDRLLADQDHAHHEAAHHADEESQKKLAEELERARISTERKAAAAAYFVESQIGVTLQKIARYIHGKVTNQEQLRKGSYVYYQPDSFVLRVRWGDHDVDHGRCALSIVTEVTPKGAVFIEGRTWFGIPVFSGSRFLYKDWKDKVASEPFDKALEKALKNPGHFSETAHRKSILRL